VQSSPREVKGIEKASNTQKEGEQRKVEERRTFGGEQHAERPPVGWALLRIRLGGARRVGGRVGARVWGRLHFVGVVCVQHFLLRGLDHLHYRLLCILYTGVLSQLLPLLFSAPRHVRVRFAFSLR
jgi:hypothetical protein